MEARRRRMSVFFSSLLFWGLQKGLILHLIAGQLEAQVRRQSSFVSPHLPHSIQRHRASSFLCFSSSLNRRLSIEFVDRSKAGRPAQRRAPFAWARDHTRTSKRASERASEQLVAGTSATNDNYPPRAGGAVSIWRPANRWAPFQSACAAAQSKSGRSSSLRACVTQVCSQICGFFFFAPLFFFLKRWRRVHNTPTRMPNPISNLFCFFFFFFFAAAAAAAAATFTCAAGCNPFQSNWPQLSSAQLNSTLLSSSARPSVRPSVCPPPLSLVNFEMAPKFALLRSTLHPNNAVLYCQFHASLAGANDTSEQMPLSFALANSRTMSSGRMSNWPNCWREMRKRSNKCARPQRARAAVQSCRSSEPSSRSVGRPAGRESNQWETKCAHSNHLLRSPPPPRASNLQTCPAAPKPAECVPACARAHCPRVLLRNKLAALYLYKHEAGA